MNKYYNFSKEQVVSEIKLFGLESPGSVRRHADGLYKRMYKVMTKEEIIKLLPKTQIHKPWTIERLYEELEQYSTVTEIHGKSIGHFYDKQPEEVKEYIKNRFFTKRRKRRPSGYWNFENFLIESRKYESRIDWMKKDPNAYSIFQKKSKKGILTPRQVKQITKHFKVLRISSERVYKYNYTKEECIAFSLKLKTAKDFWRRNNKIANYILRKGWVKECTAHLVREMSQEEIAIAQPTLLKMIKLSYPEFEVFIFSKKKIQSLDIFVSKGNMPDIIVFNPKNKNFFFIEVKKDKNAMFSKNQQYERYVADVKLNKNCLGLIVSSPTGGFRRSVSFSRTIKILKKLK